MNLVELAQRIKQLRVRQNLTLEEVAQRSGQSRSWLSKVENFRVTPSLPALGRIAQALGESIATLVEGLDENPKLVCVRSDERLRVDRDRPHSKIVYESLAHQRARRSMDPFILTVPPGERKEALSHEGEEFLMVLNGKVDFEYGEERLKLTTGDCLYFDGEEKHRLINPHKREATVLCVFQGGGETSDKRLRR